MRYIASAVLVASLAASPALAAMQATSTSKSATTTTTTKSTKSSSAEHSVRGVIKSIDASSLMLSGSGKKAAETHFVLNQSTQREGTLAVGSTVSVRYHEDGGSKVATAVVAQPAKSSTATKTSTSTKK